MKQFFTLMLTCFLSLAAAQGQILNYVEWGTKSANSDIVDVWLHNDVKLFNSTKFGASYIQFKSSDLGVVDGEDNQGYVVFPAKDLSIYGPKLLASVELSVKVQGKWSGDFDLLVSNNYQTDDPVATVWETINGAMVNTKEWSDSWDDRVLAEVEFNNANYTNAVFAIRVHDPNSNNKAARIYSVSVRDPLATNISSEWGSSISISPNPASDVLRIKGISSEVQISIRDAGGHLVLKKQQSAAGEVNVGSLAKGVYLLIIEEGQNRTVKKFIKK